MAESKNQEIQQKVREALDAQHRITLGHRASHELENDPRHLVFVLSRYKFVAKMFANRGRLLEVYVNGTAVCEPVVLDRDITPSALHVVTTPGGASTKARAEVRGEFERITIWPAEAAASRAGEK